MKGYHFIKFSILEYTIARRDEAWCMSDDDYVFLLEETQLREDNCEYDIGEANTVLQMQREEQQWVDTNTNNDEVEEEIL